jgi:hypothetical protein
MIDLFTGKEIVVPVIEEVKVKKKSPFDFAASIDNKNNFRDELEGYTPFMVNRIYSQYRETVLFANEINKYSIDNLLHYDFWYNAIPKKKRFAKWGKSEYDEKAISMIMEYYQMSHEKALSVVDLVNMEDVKKGLFKGGTK